MSRQKADQRPPRADEAVHGLRLSWCSDCLAEALFEWLCHEAAAVNCEEWACTACGAAYMDGIDIVAEPPTAKQGVA